VQSETARPVFKFDSRSLFEVAGMLIGDAVGVGCSDFLDAELQFVRDGCEKETTPISSSGAIAMVHS
jgi:hypothetical protein